VRCHGLHGLAKVVLGFGFITMAAGSGRAFAQSFEARDRAKAYLAAGNKLYGDGDYEGALNQYQQAYAAFPSPKLLFNQAQAYRGLARHVEAIEAYESFLMEDPQADAALRDEARTHMIALRAKVASVEVVSDTDGADISIDGKTRGKTPLPRPLLVAPGAHIVLVKKAGVSHTHYEKIEPQKGDKLRVSAVLERRAGPYDLRARDDGGGGGRADLVAPEQREADSGGGPVYTRWWFWTLIGAAVVGGVTAAVLITRKPEDCPTPTATFGCTKV